MRQQKRNLTEASDIHLQDSLQASLRAMVTQASRQKLLPKILWKADREFGSKKLLNYQKSIRKKYENDLKTPLKYDPEAAKSEREKFREKVMKLVTNQLEVDYFQSVRLKEGHVVTFQGHEIEERKVQTKKQFEIFRNFNEKRFKETYANLFEDKLELAYKESYRPKSNRRCNTLHILQSKHNLDPLQPHTEDSPKKSRPLFSEIRLPTPKTERKRNEPLAIQSSRKKAVLNINQKKSVGKELPHNEEADINIIFRRIGGFSNHLKTELFSVTRESINRWLREHYEKPHRLIDFLELKEVVKIGEFAQVSKRLRVMPLDHILFMTFLYYDGNNDGYICDYDLERVAQLSVKRPVILHDYHRLRQSNIKKVLSRREPYLDLYKLSEVSETVYFQWKKNADEPSPAGLQLQMKNRLLSSKQKQIFLDFDSFSSIYKFDRPFLWYDLMHLFSGAIYQGLRYD